MSGEKAEQEKLLKELAKMQPSWSGGDQNLVDCTSIALYGKKLDLVPAAVTLLTKLKILDLSGNRIKSLCQELTLLVNLEVMILSRNEVSSFPKEISLMTSLRELHLDGNRHTDYPLELSCLTQLTLLRMSENYLKQMVPGDLVMLTNLVVLHFAMNSLNVLPNEISRLSRLQELHLEGNRLNSLPSGISHLSGLTYLSIFDNPIDRLPEFITGLRKLEVLVIESKPQGTVQNLFSGGSISVKKLPIGITQLPCWQSEFKPWNSASISKALRKPSLREYIKPPKDDYVNRSNEATKREWVGSIRKGGAKSAKLGYDLTPSLLKNATILGCGTFGITFVLAFQGKQYALKSPLKADMINDSFVHAEDGKYKEPQILSSLHHPNLVTLVDTIYIPLAIGQEKYFCVLTELADDTLQRDINFSYMTDVKILYVRYMNFFHDILKGVQFLHDKEMPHGNLTPNNIFIINGVVKISNYACSSYYTRRIEANRDHLTTSQFYWLAPESVSGDASDLRASDVFVLATILWYMRVRKFPFAQHSSEEMKKFIRAGQRLPLPTFNPPHVADVIHKCWNPDPKQRPTVPELLRIWETYEDSAPAINFSRQDCEIIWGEGNDEGFKFAWQDFEAKKGNSGSRSTGMNRLPSSSSNDEFYTNVLQLMRTNTTEAKAQLRQVILQYPSSFKWDQAPAQKPVSKTPVTTKIENIKRNRDPTDVDALSRSKKPDVRMNQPSFTAAPLQPPPPPSFSTLKKLPPNIVSSATHHKSSASRAVRNTPLNLQFLNSQLHTPLVVPSEFPESAARDSSQPRRRGNESVILLDSGDSHAGDEAGADGTSHFTRSRAKK